jgi:hypothetical protein
MSSSPPSLLRRRRYGAAGYIAPKDTSPDVKYQTRHNLYYNLSTAIALQTTSTTCLQPSSCRRPPPQPVYSRRAADDLSTLHNQRFDSTTTSLLQSRRPPLQPVYSHRAADDLLYNQSATEQTISSSTSLPQSRRPPPQPVCHRADDLLLN